MRCFFRAARDLGFDYFLFGMPPDPAAGGAKAWVHGNFPQAWRRRYSMQGYAAIDPTLARCRQQNLPVIWSTELCSTPAQRAMHDEAGQCGIRFGLSVPAHGPGARFAVLCLAAGTDPDPIFLDQVTQRLPAICLLRDVLAQSCWRFAGLAAAPQALLTRREHECLREAATGNTARKIAMTMRCSVATVNFHLGNAQRKLGAPNRLSAVASAIEQGIVAR